MMRRLGWESSPLSVNWSSPVNWNHRLNEGLVSWTLVPQSFSYGQTLRNLVRPNWNFTGGNTENTDWDTPIGAQRQGGWGCINLGGTNEFFGLTTPVLTGYPCSMSCWFRVPNITATYVLMSLSNSGNGTDYMSLLAGGTLAGDPVYVEVGNPTNFNEGPNTTTGYLANVWNHACGVFPTLDPDTWRVYLNAGGVGSEVHTDVAFPTFNRTDIGAGGNSGGPWGAMLGQSDSHRFYNRALSGDEVAEEYELTQNFSVGLLNRRRRVTYFVPAAPPVGGNRRRRVLIAGAAA